MGARARAATAFHPACARGSLYTAAVLCAGDIHNDFAAMAATLCLGLTNGFISVNCMLHGRRMVPLDVREEAGYILTLCMSIGITLGVVLALPVNYWWAGQSL